MKKLIIIPVFIIAVCVSAFSVRAEEINYDMSGIYDSLSDDAKAHMLSLGADSADASDLSDLSFDTVLAEIGKMAAENLGSPLRGLISITAMLLICSMLTAYKGSLSTDMGTALDITLALCLSAAVAIPAAELIKTAGDVIVNASNLMLAYIPVTALLLTASGSIAGSAAVCRLLRVHHRLGRRSFTAQLACDNPVYVHAPRYLYRGRRFFGS